MFSALSALASTEEYNRLQEASASSVIQLAPCANTSHSLKAAFYFYDWYSHWLLLALATRATWVRHENFCGISLCIHYGVVELSPYVASRFFQFLLNMGLGQFKSFPRHLSISPVFYISDIFDSTDLISHTCAWIVCSAFRDMYIHG